MKPIRVIELFAGIGAQRQALKEAGIPHEAVAISEIDKYATASYNAIHGETPNLGDITKIQHLPECDFITYSFPCQDLSIAGHQAGMEKGSGTRSGLLWEVERLLSDMKDRGALPKYLLMENVDAILNRKNIDDFKSWIGSLTAMGYVSSYKVLNSTQFGVPQNRKRCFMVSILNGPAFIFPKGEPLTICLKDVLEDEVDESYYLSNERIAKYQRIDSSINIKRNSLKQAGDLHINPYEMANRVYDSEGLSPTIHTCQGGGIVPKIVEPVCEQVGEIKGNYDIEGRVYSAEKVSPAIRAHAGKGDPPKIIDNDRIPPLNDGEICSMITPGRIHKRQNGPRCKTDGTAYALTCQDIHGIAENDGGKLRIRYLTPRECWRLQGQPDENFDRALAIGTSKTQLYKQAGNSITVNVLTAIFKELFSDKPRGGMCNLDMFL